MRLTTIVVALIALLLACALLAAPTRAADPLHAAATPTPSNFLYLPHLQEALPSFPTFTPAPTLTAPHTPTPTPTSSPLPPATATPTPDSSAATLAIIEIVNEGRREWLTLRHISGPPQLMQGWTLTSYDGTQSPCLPLPSQVYTFPPSFALAPGQTVRIHSGPDAATVTPGPADLLWATTYIWNNNGDRADLRLPDASLADTYAYGICQ